MKIKYVFLLITVSLLFSCKKEKSRICELYDGDVEYAIGTIQTYVKLPFKVVYKYDFEVNGEEYNGKEKAYGIGQLNKELLGKRVVVIYEANNPSNSDLNTDYFIGTEDDFNDFITEFSSSPPPPDFPNNCK